MTAQVTAGCVEDFMFDKINCIFFFFFDICHRGLFVIKVTMVMNLK